MCPRASTSLAAARRTNLARAVVPWMFRKRFCQETRLVAAEMNFADKKGRPGRPEYW